jgi:hypothetical protein
VGQEDSLNRVIVLILFAAVIAGCKEKPPIRVTVQDVVEEPASPGFFGHGRFWRFRAVDQSGRLVVATGRFPATPGDKICVKLNDFNEYFWTMETCE